MVQPLEFREFRKSDFPGYLRWYQEDGLLERFLGPMEDNDEWLVAVLNPGPGDQTIAVTMPDADGEQLVGVMNICVDRDTCSISAIATHPDFRGRGFGHQMLDYLSAIHQKLIVHVNQENFGALRFFAEHGFLRQSAAAEMVTLELGSRAAFRHENSSAKF